MVTYLEAEEYRFYRMYSIDLQGAKQTIQMLPRFPEPDVRYSIIRDAVVAYARPFSKNRGKFLKFHRLPDSIVPRERLELHAELITLRDQAFAHSDHEFFKPQLIGGRTLVATIDTFLGLPFPHGLASTFGRPKSKRSSPP